jgi:hypothetical protein
MLISGRIGELIIFIVLVFALIIAIWKSGRGRLPTIRRLPAIDAIEELVGRATETGRPILFTPGYGGGNIRGTAAYPFFAAMNIMAYTVQLSAKLGAEFMSLFCQPEAIPIARALILESLRMEGKQEMWKEGMVRFITPLQFAYTTGVLATMSRERVAGTILVGPYWAEALIFAEYSNTIGAMSIAGTESATQLPFFVGVCDYTLIGEELYAVGAYVSKSPIELGSIEGEDWCRIIIMFIIIIGLLIKDQVTYLLKL